MLPKFDLSIIGAMGIDADVAKFLFFSRSKGVDFTSTLMLGNQRLEADKKILKKYASQFGISDLENISNSEDFFKSFAAEEVSAMDISDYENAKVIHDLNKPIPNELVEKYSFVIDGGTLEHVFNFPVAIENTMKMVKLGGHLVIVNGGNNFLGHGFYQFSPELFFRVFSDENGFEIVKMVAAEVGGRWFEVSDPKKINSRVELINNRPVYLMVLARRTDARPIFETNPYQSDYVEIWNSENQKPSTNYGSLRHTLQKIPALWNFLIKLKHKQILRQLAKERSFQNNRAYKQMDI